MNNDTGREWEQRSIPACPNCASALARAEQAEKAAAIWEQRCSQAAARSGEHLGELAAASRERDTLREKMKRINDAIHRSSLHNTKATVKRLDVPLVTLSPDDAQAILDAAREALEEKPGG